MIASIYQQAAFAIPCPAPKRFLLLDDDRSFITKLTRESSAAGATLIVFDRLEKMIEFLETEPESFDGLITELKIGGNDAFSIYDRVKQFLPELKIVIVTAYSGVETAVSSVKYGFEHYYAKPIEFSLIQQTFEGEYKPSSVIPEKAPVHSAEFMSADRVKWEHIQRIYHMSEYNVSETARRLKMHRRTLQRILSKHAPK